MRSLRWLLLLIPVFVLGRGCSCNGRQGGDEDMLDGEVREAQEDLPQAGRAARGLGPRIRADPELTRGAADHRVAEQQRSLVG